jgi:hypothetical protein
VARSNPRLAAGAGAVAVFLLLGGSGAAVAFADPGGSQGSDRGNNSDRGGSGGGVWKRDNDRGANGGGRGASRDGGDEKSGDDGSGSPRVRVGSGREDTARLSPRDSSDSAGGSGSSGGGSSSDSPGATSAFEPPRVTFGNGRAPGVHGGDPESRFRAPVPQPAEPPPPPPPPPSPAQYPSWVDRIATPPAAARQFVVAPAAALSDPLWGIAGLLLIPAAGAVLGYRQARAAQSAERLNRS